MVLGYLLLCTVLLTLPQRVAPGATRVGDDIVFDEPVNDELGATYDTEPDFGWLTFYHEWTVKNFHDLVFAAGLPWGDYAEIMQQYLGPLSNSDSDSNATTTANPLFNEDYEGNLDYIRKSNLELLRNDWSKYLAFAIIVMVCMLFLLVFPLFAIIFCCCRICKQCGGRRVQKDPSSTCCIVLLIGSATTLAAMGGACALMFGSNQLFSEDVPTEMISFSGDVSPAAVDWAETTIDTLFEAALGPWDSFLDIVFDELGNAGEGIFEPILDHINASLHPSFVAVDAPLEDMRTEYETTMVLWNNTYYQLSTEAQNMYEISESLRIISTALSGDGTCTGDAGCGAVIDEIDKHLISDSDFATATSSLTTSFDLPDAYDSFSGEAMMDDINARSNDTIYNLTQSQIDELIETMRNQTDDITNAIEDARATLTDAISSGSFNETPQFLLDVQDQVEAYELYRVLGGMGLIAPPFVVFVLGLIGLLLGILGHDATVKPQERSKMQNCGGHFVCASAVVSMLFVYYYVAGFVYPFALLAVPQMVCNGLQDGDIIEEIVDRPYLLDTNNEYILGDRLLGNGSYPLTITSVLNACRSGDTIWNALKMDESALFDIDENLNTSKIIGNTTELFGDAFAFNFSEFNLAFDTFADDIYGMADNLTDYTTNLDELLAAADKTIKAYAIQLNTSWTGTAGDNAAADEALAATTCGTTDTSCDSLADIRTALAAVGVSSTVIDQALDDLDAVIADQQQFESDTDEFYASMATLNATVIEVSDRMKDLAQALDDTTDDLIANGTDYIIDSATAYADMLLGWVDAYMNHVLDSFRDNVGTCKFLIDTWDAIWVYVCDYTVLELSAIYFSSGLIAVTLISNAIWNIKLSKYFKKMEDDKPDNKKQKEKPRRKVQKKGSAVTPVFVPIIADEAPPVSVRGAPKPAYSWNVKRPWEPGFENLP